MADLTLKWGNVKGWDGMDEGHPAREALNAYLEHAGVSAMERQSDEQRERICAVIDAIDGDIYDDWNGGTLTKEDAKAYVRNYGKERVAP